MNRPVGVCITQSSAYKLYAFYYFYIVVISVSVCQKIFFFLKCPNNKKETYNDKDRQTRDRLFGLEWGEPSFYW